MKVDSKLLYDAAKQGQFAIPHANFIDFHSARAYVAAAEKRQLPFLLAYAQSHSSIITLEEAAAIGNYFAEAASVPVVLHLDHGEDTAFIERAIELGFTSVMIDASQKSFAENTAITQQVVDYAHDRGVVVEAELGHVGANETSEAAELTGSVYTEVDKVQEFVAATHVDSLAVSIGTAHGVYKGSPKINFERLHEIAALTDVPLVLHGGSSSGDENLGRCAREGITKINIYTDFIVGAYQAIVKEQPKDYISLQQTAEEAMAAVLDHYFDVFGTQKV
ncbi:class II fructose-bisphosphate aldolase [Streptococcus chenjunshii]|uniref:Class II fructose-bisphosphate aldolase n=1 Tax=Streptococcus chenjunshii TaxID=2173853 RepID=A0A372KND4_9STRE|nr:class II fructose-bisphosphate aldolase [Streptococcus chenjunshii]AXQ77830.1 class II fructose-bisphosphate aldolase [Streptococcus chenjunshii]RFU51341.1 class II fructose-bisphosphate aldolase [Streptococcus chenjunshii]RFU53785.1 class II fructose-bisphosphate aldolase [Streptococcus chenjunshii]